MRMAEKVDRRNLKIKVDSLSQNCWLPLDYPWQSWHRFMASFVRRPTRSRDKKAEWKRMNTPWRYWMQWFVKSGTQDIFRQALPVGMSRIQQASRLRRPQVLVLFMTRTETVSAAAMTKLLRLLMMGLTGRLRAIARPSQREMSRLFSSLTTRSRLPALLQLLIASRLESPRAAAEISRPVWVR